MKIGIITTVLDRSSHTTGVFSYGYSLIKHCRKYADEVQIYLIHRRKNNNSIYREGKEIIVPTFPFLPPLRGIITNLFKLPVELNKNGINTIHIISPTIAEMVILFLPGVKKILTVHDLFIFTKKIPLISIPFRFKFKEVVGQRMRILLFFLTKNRVDQFIAVSQNTKRDLIRYLRIPREKIEVTYETTEKRIKKGKRIAPLDFINKKPYILGFPVNNSLLEIFKIIKEKGRQEKLVLFGDKKTLEKAQRFAEKNNLEEEIIIAGFIPDNSKLISLYANARLLLYHAVYEGFGLPALEAISCGCPVIGSNVSSVPEVVGEAGFLIKPYDVEKWANTACEILSSEELRSELVNKTWKQANKFLGENVAKKTLEIYKKFI